jgi:hypothetical protein
MPIDSRIQDGRRPLPRSVSLRIGVSGLLQYQLDGPAIELAQCIVVRHHTQAAFLVGRFCIMCRFLAAACWLILVVTVSAQTDRGSLSGTVSYASGLIVPDAPVQAKHKETGAIIRTVSAADGGYVFADIRAGVYELSIAMPGCSFDPFAGDVTVRAGQTTRLDVRLVDTLNGQTLGDDPCRIADMIRRRSTVPSLPVRRFADGQPDLSGAWLVSQDRFPEQPAALPWAVGLAKERVESNFN